MINLTIAELELGLDFIRKSPKDNGIIELLVKRPDINEREIINEAELDLLKGLVGDSWVIRKNLKRDDNSPHPDKQLNIMNSRVINLIAQKKERWALAGDQIYIDLDLSLDNLPAGTKLSIGSAIIEVTSEPHTGCKKFVERFGIDAMKFVNSPIGRELNLRGINAKIIQGGLIKIGDIAKKI